MKKVVKLVKRSTPEEVADQFNELDLFRLAKAYGVSTKEMAKLISDSINSSLVERDYKLLENKGGP